MNILILILIPHLWIECLHADQVRHFTHSNLSLPSKIFLVYYQKKIQITFYEYSYAGYDKTLKLHVNDDEVNFFVIADWGGIFNN